MIKLQLAMTSKTTNFSLMADLKLNKGVLNILLF